MVKVGKVERALLKEALKTLAMPVCFGVLVLARLFWLRMGRLTADATLKVRFPDFCICDERNAINRAVLRGNKRIREIAVVADAKTLVK